MDITTILAIASLVGTFIIGAWNVRAALSGASDEISQGAATLLAQYRIELEKATTRISDLERELSDYKEYTNAVIAKMKDDHQNEIAEMIKTHAREISVLETKLDRACQINHQKESENNELLRRIEKLEKRDTGELSK